MHVEADVQTDFDREAAARRLIPVVTRLARRYAHSAKRPHLEDEYVSESLVALAHALDTYAPDAGKTLQTWTYGLTVQALWKLQDKDLRRDELAHMAMFDEAKDVPWGDESRDEWERDEDAASLLRGLDMADRHMIRELFWRGSTVSALARECGAKRWVIQQRRDEILARFREQLS